MCVSVCVCVCVNLQKENYKKKGKKICKECESDFFFVCGNVSVVILVQYVCVCVRNALTARVFRGRDVDVAAARIRRKPSQARSRALSCTILQQKKKI